MNNPKLTNALLIALIVLNGLFLMAWAAGSMHRHHHRRFMAREFHGRTSCRFMAFHKGFEAYRGDYGGFHGGFRNHHRDHENNNKAEDKE